MRRLCVTAGSLLAAAGLLLGMICLPAAASAASPNISITSAGPDASGDPYDLTVTADDGNGLPIQSMTAHVTNAGGSDVADPTMTAQSTSNLAAQTWVAATPIPQAALPPGTYTVTVDATDANETDLGLQTPGFSFAYTSNLTVAIVPSYVTQGSQNVTFSGQLTGSAPGGSWTGIAGAPVMLGIGSGAPIQVATDANGNFSYSASNVTPGSYAVSVAASATYSAASYTVSVPAQAATTSIINMQASPPNVTLASQNVTFTGTVQMVPPNSSTPVGIGSGVPVYVSVNGGTPVFAADTSDASGDFTYNAAGIAQSTTFVFSVPQTSLYGPSSAPAITIGTLTAPTSITTTANPAYITYGSQSVTFTGTVQAKPGSGPAVGVGSGVPVYLSVNGTSPTQVTTTTDANGDFSYQTSGLTASSTYTFSVNGTSLYSAASYPVQVNLDPGATSIAVTANPPDVHLGSSTVTFSGTVSVTPFGSTTATGVGSGVPVYLSVGSGTATQVTTTDDANGDFTYQATNVTQPGDYEFSVQGATFYTAQLQTVAIGLEQLDSTMTVTASSPSITEGAQSVTFSGNLTGALPGGTPMAIPNAPVDLSVDGVSAGQVATTDSSGNFSYPVSNLTQADTYQFSVGSTSDYTEAAASVPVGVIQAQTRITTTRTSPANLTYGQSATLTGTVQYFNGSTWTALGGASVQVSLDVPAVGTPTSAGTVTSAGDGTFTIALPTRYGTSWTATAGAAALTQQAQTSGTMNVSVPAVVKWFKASLSVHGKVSVQGCMQAGDSIGYGPQPLINIQYRAGTSGPWSAFGPQLLLLNQGSLPTSCRGTEDSYFSGIIPAKLDNAYYRASFPATASREGYGFPATASSVVHAWKYPTRLATFTVTPRTVRKGQAMHLKVQLQKRVGKRWEPWAGQKVTFKYDYPRDKTAWVVIPGTKKTNKTGYTSNTIRGIGGNFIVTMYAFYQGGPTYLASGTRGINVSNSNPRSHALPVPEPGSLGFVQLQNDAYIVLPELYPEQVSLTALLES